MCTFRGRVGENASGLARLFLIREVRMEFQSLAIGKILAGEYAQRSDEDDPGIDELAASIRRVGVLVPLVVANGVGGYTVIAGHRRLAAATKVGLKFVPCIVRSGSESDYKEVSFAENLFRKDLTPIELACAMRDCLHQAKMSVEELAAGLHRSTNWVRAQVAMLDWPGDVLEAIHNGKISVAAASNLALVTDEVYREFLVRQAVENGATARATAAWLQAFSSMAPASEAVTREPVAAGERAMPMVPQAPCIVCSNVYRTDELSHVPVCVGCIKTIRMIGQGG